jgi:hypothetical protein
MHPEFGKIRAPPASNTLFLVSSFQLFKKDYIAARMRFLFALGRRAGRVVSLYKAVNPRIDLEAGLMVTCRARHNHFRRIMREERIIYKTEVLLLG